MELELVSNYQENDILRKSFDDLSRQIFGISFESWYQAGLWKGNYICHSFRVGDKIAANVSVTKLRLIEGMRERKVMQLGTVMTAPDYRERGLARKLLEYIDNKYSQEYRAFFLFANSDVLNFYPKFGFEETERLEFFTTENFRGKSPLNFRKLDLEKKKDREILVSLTEDRLPTSDRFFIRGGEEVLYWYCLGIFKNNVYYNEDEEIIIIYSIEGATLNIYDLITRKEFSYREVLNSIYREGIKETVFHYNLEPAEFSLEKRVFAAQEEDDPMFIKGDLDMSEATFPITVHT